VNLLTSRHLLVLCCVSAVLLFARLGGARLWDRDEPRNAGCAAEMLQRGDWIVPVFNDKLRVHKPVLLYWLIMSSYTVFGVNEFAARFWSAALGVGTVLLTYLIGRRLFSSGVGLWGGLVLSTCVVFALSARAATPDSTLLFCTTLATLIYVVGSFSPTGEPNADFFPRRWAVVFAMYAAMGLATLAKGPVGFILPTAVIGMFLLIIRLPQATFEKATGPKRVGQIVSAAMRPFHPIHFAETVWSMRPITALAAILIVALPWYVAVGLRTHGEWPREFFLEQNVGRVMDSMENHRGGPWYYPVALFVGSFPWVIVLIPAIICAFRWVHARDDRRSGLLLVLCWLFVYLVVFSVPRTKLPTYIIPVYPAVALLIGVYLWRWMRNEPLPDRLRSALVFGMLATIGVGIVVAVTIVAGRTIGGGQWLAVLGVIPIAGAAVCYALARNERRVEAARALFVTAACITLAIFAVAAPAVDKFQHSDKLLAAIRSNHPSPRVAALGRLEPSWVFYLGRPIVEFPKAGAAEAEAFLKGGPDTFLITTPERLESLRKALSPELLVLERVPYFSGKGDLVVVGRATGNNAVKMASTP
jgi:4-amino-4-deoxy-L-arabinose transferase-like glycosyltransferase